MDKQGYRIGGSPIAKDVWSPIAKGRRVRISKDATSRIRIEPYINAFTRHECHWLVYSPTGLDHYRTNGAFGVCQHTHARRLTLNSL
jgi:hypothetical protein